MSPDQRKMAFGIWRDCWAAIQETPAVAQFADEKAARMAITKKAIGREKSWGDVWAQKPIDHLFAVMWAIAQSDNLELQLRQIDQPLTRAEGSLFAQAMLDAIGIEAAGREGYLNGIAKRIHKVPLCEIDDEQWRDILSALHHTAQHKTGEAHSHPRSKWHRRKSDAMGASGPVSAAIDSVDIGPKQAPAPARVGNGNPF